MLFSRRSDLVYAFRLSLWGKSFFIWGLDFLFAGSPLEEMVDKTLEQVENKNDVGENFHRDLPFHTKVQRIAASNRPEHPVIFAACRGGADAGIGKIAVCIFHI